MAKLNNGYGAQALDINQLVDLHGGTGIVSGCAASVGTNAMEVDVASGTARVNGTNYSITASTVLLDSANADYPRKDLVVVDSTGSVTKITGTAETAKPAGSTRRDTYQPKPEDVSGTDVAVIAEVWVGAGASDIVAGDISDRRIFTHSDGFKDTNGDGVAELDDSHADFQGGDARNVGALGADELSISNAQIQARLDGMVVPVAPGLGANDAVPPSNDNPVNDAIASVATAGNGFVFLPNEEVTQLQPVTAKSKVGIKGARGASKISIDAAAGALFQTDGVDVRSATFEGFNLVGQGAANHTADCIIPNGAEFIDCTFRELLIGKVQGRGWSWGSLGGYQNSFERIRWDDIDAGAENAMFEWDGASEAPITLRDWSVYPDDSASAADSVLFIDSQTTAGSASVVIDGYLNIGGTAGKIIQRAYNEYNIPASVNWEPTTQNSTPSQLFSVLRSRNFNFSGTLKVQGTTGDVFSCPFNSGLVELPNPRVSGTVNGDLLDVGGQSDTIQYGGVGPDVNNTSGGALAPGVACLGDMTLQT